jgi:hypothetical protein
MIFHEAVKTEGNIILTPANHFPPFTMLQTDSTLSLWFSFLLCWHIKIYKTIILPVIVYECEALSLTLREEHRLRVFENRVLWRIFVPKRDEVTGRRKLHNEELHGLYSSPSIVRVIKARRMRWVMHVVRMGEVRDAYSILVGRPEGRRPLGKPRHRWEDNIKMDLREIGFGDVDWINPFTALIDFKFFPQNVSDIHKNHKVNILTLLCIF